MCFPSYHLAGPRGIVPSRESAQDNADARHNGSTPEVVIPQRMRHLARLRRVRDRIDQEYAQPLDVEALARDAHMSAGHLSRQFRLAYGESPYGYVMTRRIERAMALLRCGDLSVTEVYFAVGCSSLRLQQSVHRAGQDAALHLRPVATDLDWSIGTGREVRGFAEAINMTVAGRTTALAELAGHGHELASSFK
jgi:AraC-like DNA-binding protein